jgi:hypothetical protein
MIKNHIRIISIFYFLSFILSGCKYLNNSINNTQKSSNLITPSLSLSISQTILASSLDIHEMALDDDFIYLITKVVKQVDRISIESNQIDRISKSGGKGGILIQEDLNYYNLMIDDKYLYWISISQAGSIKETQYVKKINKSGGKPINLYQEDSNIGSLIQKDNYIYFTSKSKQNLDTTKLLQINKSDNSIKIISENKEDINNILLHKGYVYWSTCTYDRIKKESFGNIYQNNIRTDNTTTIISDDCYGYPYETENGVYWFGKSAIFIEDTSNRVTPILNMDLLKRGYGNVNPGDKSIETYISNIIQIDDKYIYFSEVLSATSGFKSCTDESEALIKYSLSDNVFTDISRFDGEIKYFRIQNALYLISECAKYYRVVDLNTDKVKEVELGTILLFAVDENRLYWVNEEGSLLARERDRE